MRSSRQRLLALAVTSYAVCCWGQTEAPVDDSGCVTDFDETVDYFPDKINIDYADTWGVQYNNSYKVVSSGDYNYVLYQCGTPVPDVVGMEVQQNISVPVTKVATGTPGHIPFIEMLGKRDTIVAYDGDPDYIGSACVTAAINDGDIAVSDLCNNANDNEVLIDAGVEVTFFDSLLVSDYCPNANMSAYNVFPVYSYDEEGDDGSLGSGEALKLFSLFYNEEAKANELFDDVESLYFCTQNNAEGCSLELNNTPSVAWIPYVSIDPEYGEGFEGATNDSYYHVAITRAGGEMIVCPGHEGAYMNDTVILDCLGDADVCVFGQEYEQVVNVTDAETLNSMKCVQDGRVFDITLSTVNTWFQYRSVEPHVLLEDLVVVVHGDGFNYGLGDYERLLLRDVFSEETGSGPYFTSEVCTDPDADLLISGQCDVIIDFGTCDEEDSAAARASAWTGIACATLLGAVGAFVQLL